MLCLNSVETFVIGVIIGAIVVAILAGYLIYNIIKKAWNGL